jgi:hypothetical protein
MFLLMIPAEYTNEYRFRSSSTPITRLLASTMPYRTVRQGPTSAAEARLEPLSKVLSMVGQHRNGSHPDAAQSLPELTILEFALGLLSVGKSSSSLDYRMSQIAII